jgi:hypothetical protein
MSDINKMISDVGAIRKSALHSLHEYMTAYAHLEKEVHDRFNDEYRHNNHKLAGLEDFHSLSYKCKKNLTTIKSACNLLERISDLSGFDIKEEDELIRDLDRILKE